MRSSLIQHSDLVTEHPVLETPDAGVPDSGVVVLSSTMQIRYMSGRAAELMKTVQQEAEPAFPGVLPAVIEDFGLELMKMLSTHVQDGIGFNCELRRLAGQPERPILLRGFALIKGRDLTESHVVVILQERSGRC